MLDVVFPAIAGKIALHVPDEKSPARWPGWRCGKSTCTEDVTMKLHNTSAEILVPVGKPVADALTRITHLGIGAHQDDLEFMAFHGILAGYQDNSRCFGGVTCTNGNR